MRRPARLTLPLLALATATVVAAPAVAQDFTALPQRIETQLILGEAVRFDILPEYRIVPLGGTNQIDARLRIGLGDLAARSAAILTALAAQRSTAELVFDFPQIDPPTAGNGAIWLSGIIRVQTRDPVFGAPIAERAEFTLALRPVATANAVSVAADLTRFDVGGGFLGAMGVQAALRDLVESELRRGLSGADAVYVLPASLAAYGISITGVEVVDLGGGVPGILAAASAMVSDVQLMTAIIEVTTAL